MEHLTGNTYFSHSKGPSIGGYLVKDQLLLIDTGLDDSSVRKAIRDFSDIDVAYIFNTHSHADHCGGNAYIQKQYTAHTFAPELEATFIEQPVLEPIYLYGSCPLTFMKNKYTMAKPSKVHQHLHTSGPFTIEFDGKPHRFQLLKLPGHSPNMMGIVTPDQIAFLGDALISDEAIEKHPLIFTYDVAAHLKTLEQLEKLDAKGYIIAHGGYYTHIDHLIASNRNVLIRTQNYLIDRLHRGAYTIEELHAHITEVYQLEETPLQYSLNHSVIKAHLSTLEKQGKVSITVTAGNLKFTAEPGA
jgi:glyoxylase-like metal-dependent hydrolase (beta-lactamase superfamily II)